MFTSLRFLFALSLFPVLAVSCHSAALQSREIRFKLYDSPILVKESGAVIVKKRQVGRILEDGKVVDNRGRPLAWVRENDIRLRGGITLDIKTDSEGTMYLPKAAQEKANLKPIPHRIRKDGTMATTKNARGLPVQGAHLAKNRRIVLLLLVLDANSLWP